MGQGSNEPKLRTYTFLYTDIVGSSRLWEANSSVMGAMVEDHNSIVTAAVEASGGRVFKSLGDGLACVFEAADAAVRSGVKIQKSILGAGWACPMEIRVGIHSGSAQTIGDDFGGPSLNRVSRITDLAEGGQIIVSESCRGLALDFLGDSIELVAIGEAFLAGMDRPERLYRVKAEGLRASDFFLESDELRGHNLEALAHPFIGRAAERRDLVARLLGSEQRLITVVGFGGIGKTTLAKQSALDALDSFKQKVFWIECEALRTLDDLVAAILLTLGPAVDAPEQESALFNLLKDHRALLVCDCFENMTAHGGFLDRLVRRCPKIKVLVTSRIVLGSEAEYLLELRGMSGKRSSTQESEAVELFLSHVSRHTPEFGKKPAERKLAGQLVRELEFVPLAIVICAGRLRYTPIQALHEQVQSSLLSTVRSVRDQHGRHSGLLRVIQMSFDLLDPGDQLVLQGLAVFDGGFTLEAALKVLSIALGSKTVGEIEGSIFRLRDHSLVSISASGSGDRYRLLDSVREFLAEQMSGVEQVNLATCHSQHFLKVAESIRDLSAGNEWSSASELWRAESANLRKALATAVTESRGVANFARALARMLLETGHYADLELICREGYDEARRNGDLGLEIELLGLEGIAQRRHDQINLCIVTFSRRADLCRRAGDMPFLADSLCDVAMACLRAQNNMQAETTVDEVLAMGELASSIRISALGLKAVCCARASRHTEARAYATEAEHLVPTDPSSIFSVSRSICEAYRLCGDFEHSCEVMRKSLSKALEANYVSTVGSGLLELAETKIEGGDLYEAALALACASQIPSRLAPSLSRRVSQAIATLDSLGSIHKFAEIRRGLAAKSWQTNIAACLSSKPNSPSSP